MTAIRPLYIVIIILLLVSAVLAFDAVSSSVNPYRTVAEVTQDPAWLHRDVQVLATVTDLSVDPDGAMQLVLTDGNATLNVTYRGVPPQGLLAGQKIVAIGRMDSPARLEADRLLVKCPSKYG